MKRIMSVFLSFTIVFAVVNGCNNNHVTDGKNTPGQAQKIAVEDLSSSIKDAITASFPKGIVQDVVLEDEDGTDVYEAEIVENGQKYDVQISLAGEILEIEQEIESEDLPELVSEAINAGYQGASILLAEKVTRGDTTVYEVGIIASGNKLEVVIDGNGKIIEEKAEQDSQEESDDLDADDEESEHEFEGEEEGEH